MRGLPTLQITARLPGAGRVLPEPALARNLHRQIDRALGRIRAPELSTGVFHPIDLLRVLDQPGDLPGQPFRRELPLDYHQPGPGPLERLGVLTLVVVGREGEGDEYGRLPGRRDFRRRGRSRAAYEQVRRREMPGHVLDERPHVRAGKSGFLVPLLHSLELFFARLVRDRKSVAVGGEPGQSRDHRVIDRAGALAPSEYQDGEPGPARLLSESRE